jgi:hypothetical protein
MLELENDENNTLNLKESQNGATMIAFTVKGRKMINQVCLYTYYGEFSHTNNHIRALTIQDKAIIESIKQF